jgi:OPA family sugar phosphate sensor protein UhpC-like MFS transporter
LVDTIALAAFGFAIGGLIVFLAGLIAVDLMPVGAAGAVKGVIGLFSYLGAASQDWISGVLIDDTKTVVDGVTTYSFDTAFYFWISASVVSMLLALFAWNKRPHE